MLEQLRQLTACVFGVTMGNIGSKSKGRPPLEASLARSKASGVLSLSAQRLAEVPPQVYECAGLRFLDLSVNRLRRVDAALGALVSLQRLSLSNNKLEDLPALGALGKLKELNVSHNQLATLPTLPPSLVTLNASHNRFPELPAPALTMRALVTVDFSHNQIGRLGGFGDATAPLQLRALNLDSNAIAELPADWQAVPKLVTLSLQGNRLDRVPPSLLADTAVANLSLAGNRLTKKAFLRTEGADAFMERRKQTKDKGIAGGLHPDTGVCGLTD